MAAVRPRSKRSTAGIMGPLTTVIAFVLVSVISFFLGRLTRATPSVSNRDTAFTESIADRNVVRTTDLLSHLPDCDRPQSPLTLQELALKYKPSKFWRYAHTNFERFYPQYLEKYRTKQFRMLEIGLDAGTGSLLWLEYFPCVDLTGLEYVADKTRTQGASAIKTIVGDQGDADFLNTEFMKQTQGRHFDVIVDDGGHHYEQQRTSYEVLFERALNPGGVYLLEDVETSYWKKGTDLYKNKVTRGGHEEPSTIVNNFKQVVDVINKKFFDNSYFVFGKMDQLIATITFGSNLIILTKKDREHCFSESLYVWDYRLADDCPARTQKPDVLKGSPMHQYCGDKILTKDDKDRRQEWLSFK